MKRVLILASVVFPLPILVVITACSVDRAGQYASDNKPMRQNILLVVADDLGSTDLGYWGSEIQTPNLDRLAARGVALTNFYAAPTCSPTRSMLLSGTDHHLAGLGTMVPSPKGTAPPGYEGYMNDRVVSIANLLRESGYHTYIAGKWHLGVGEGQGPESRGFERSFTLMPGGASHFSDATPVIPRGSNKVEYRADGKNVTLPKDFYSSEFYTDTLIEYIDENRADGKPFFAYAAYTAPHAPLQAPDDDLDNYAGTYDEGYEVLRAYRLQRLKELDMVAGDTTLGPSHSDVPVWGSLSEEEKKYQSRRMEIYAAMVTNLDAHIGRLVAYLESIGELDNTVIIFLSDNGADGWNFPKMFNATAAVNQHYDNSESNLGKENSYLHLGAGWAQASTAPHSLFKGFTTEGGIHVPAFVAGPGLTRNGTRDSSFLTVMDVAPTILDIAKVRHPGIQYHGREILPIKGKSIWPYLQGRATEVHPEDYVAGWELFGSRAIRQGNWKLVYSMAPLGSGSWELFDLVRDPAESVNLAESNPEQFGHMKVLWDRYVRENGVQENINHGITLQ